MKKILMLAALLSLSACGFHLKGTSGFSQTLAHQSWHIQNGGEMQQAVENALRRASGKPVADARDAQMTLQIRHVGRNSDIYTISRAALINEYLLTLRIEAQALKNGEPVGEPMNIVVTRTMNYADSEALGKQEEEETIWSEMRTDAAEQIVTRLSFLKAR